MVFADKTSNIKKAARPTEMFQEVGEVDGKKICLSGLATWLSRVLDGSLGFWDFHGSFEEARSLFCKKPGGLKAKARNITWQSPILFYKFSSKTLKPSPIFLLIFIKKQGL